MNMRKLYLNIGVLALGAMVLAGCSNGSDGGSFNKDRDITVVSREEGSGTRGAFIELMGIEEKDSSGNKVDKTTKEAVIASKTDVMLTNVAGDDYAIGYVSLGSLNDSIKALKIDGIEASKENIKSGSYKVARPFNIAVKEDLSEVAKDFISYILSAEGQEIVAKDYIAVNDAATAYAGNKPSGKIVVAGSSSVNPIMEKLAEAYMKLNSNATIEIQANDSTSGINSAIDGTCDIGMSSRDLKDSESEKLKAEKIAMDGIAVITNNNNPLESISASQVKSIFVGELTSWSEIE